MFTPDAGKSGEGNFAENKQLFGNAKTQPEKFNLYNGLQRLAAAVTAQDRKIDELNEKLDVLIKLLKR